MNQITLTIEDKAVALVFVTDGQEVARDVWFDSNNLLEQFFPRFSALLEKNPDFSSQNVTYSFFGDLSKGYTTLRIGKTIMNTLSFSGQMGKKV